MESEAEIWWWCDDVIWVRGHLKHETLLLCKFLHSLELHMVPISKYWLSGGTEESNNHVVSKPLVILGPMCRKGRKVKRYIVKVSPEKCSVVWKWVIREKWKNKLFVPENCILSGQVRKLWLVILTLVIEILSSWMWCHPVQYTSGSEFFTRLHCITSQKMVIFKQCAYFLWHFPLWRVLPCVWMDTVIEQIC